MSGSLCGTLLKEQKSFHCVEQFSNFCVFSLRLYAVTTNSVSLGPSQLRLPAPSVVRRAAQAFVWAVYVAAVAAGRTRTKQTTKEGAEQTHTHTHIAFCSVTELYSIICLCAAPTSEARGLFSSPTFSASSFSTRQQWPPFYLSYLESKPNSWSH